MAERSYKLYELRQMFPESIEETAASLVNVEHDGPSVGEAGIKRHLETLKHEQFIEYVEKSLLETWTRAPITMQSSPAFYPPLPRSPLIKYWAKPVRRRAS